MTACSPMRVSSPPASQSPQTPRLIPLRDFTEEEKSVYRELEAELLGLRGAASGEPAEEKAFSRSWHFTDDGPATFICAQLP